MTFSGHHIVTRGQRIMILRLVFDNPLVAKDLQQADSSCCPNSCPSVEVDMDLARIVARWQLLTEKDKRILFEIVG